MNREEAIRYCDEYLARHISDIDKEFLKKAKEALQQEPCDDAISRQAVLDAIEDDNRNGHYSCFASNNDAQCFKGVIGELPSVNPQEPKTGRWIFDEVLDKHYYCSECKSMGVVYWDYCPNCCAKMEERRKTCSK